MHVICLADFRKIKITQITRRLNVTNFPQMKNGQKNWRNSWSVNATFGVWSLRTWRARKLTMLYSSGIAGGH